MSTADSLQNNLFSQADTSITVDVQREKKRNYLKLDKIELYLARDCKTMTVYFKRRKTGLLIETESFRLEKTCRSTQ